MQKVITVSLDTRSLMSSGAGRTVVEEISEVNALLESGWDLEEFEVLHKDESTGKVLMWLVLSDDLFLPDEDWDEDEEEDFDLDDL